MFNQARLKEVLVPYKQNFFPQWWAQEKYKWEAVKCFQENWDINAADFSQMLTLSLSKTDNLLASSYFFPKKMIRDFAKSASEEVRVMFINLFDESKDIFERIDTFKSHSDILLQKYGNGEKNHYQTENTISTYLWLRYPDKYYIYKFKEAEATADTLESSYSIKEGLYEDNIRNFLKLYDEINSALKKDTELVSLVKSQLTDDCYPDPELKTLTIDLGHYIKQKCSKTKNKKTKTKDENKEIGKVDQPPEQEKYGKSAFLSEVFMSEESYDDLVALLEKKRNVILQGAPGVGKTFAAERLAYSIMGEKDKSRVKLVQFHQNYSYEDFVMGYKPDENGFKLQDGIFYSFCKKAENDADNEFFFIIDEINRGNLSKIFGELLMLIENEHRGDKVTLAYNGLTFSVPKNLYIIGMMNTADRSLAMIDYALRRRFSFFDMEPAFDSEGFKNYRKGLKNETFDRLIEKIKELNNAISEDGTLGKDFCIGHSYFCNIEKDKLIKAQLRSIVNYDILPTLSEYWFDDREKIQQWEKSLKDVIE